MNPVAVAHRTNSASDGVLVQEAAAGGGASYATLYDRYSQQVYNYCLRLTGSPEDAADATQDAFVNVLARLHQDDRPVLDFASYLFVAARNESYALMRRRSRTHSSEETPERAPLEPDVETDPERAVLLRDSQQAVRMANATLAPRHREVLALREVGGRSYEEIGDIMGISENAAAQLIWRARSKLKVALTAGAVASVIATTEDCETAQVLINRLHDGESITDDEHEWLEDHLDECAKCRTARGMLFEVATSYRMWAPVAVLATMKADVLAAAGDVVGADWTSPHLSGGSGAGSNGGGGSSNGTHAGRFSKRPRGTQAAAGAAVTAAVMAGIGIVAIGLGGEDAGVKPPLPAKPAAVEKKSTAPKAEKASIKATPIAAQRIHANPRVIPGQLAGPNDQSGAAAPNRGGPDGSPRSEPRGESPNTPGNGPGGGQPGNPGGGQPGGGNPGNPPGGNPGGGNPGNPPGDNPGGGPGNPPGNPGGGPTNPPGGNPGGGPADTPPVDTPPVIPPTGGECNWPGQGGGPSGCPPGHGGIPPGLGGTPPGQGKKP